MTCVTEAARAAQLVERQFFSVMLVDIDTPSPRAGVLTGEAVRWVLGWLRERFDLVFLDGPAWGAGGEAASPSSATGSGAETN